MELLIAVLIAFGVVSAEQGKKLNEDPKMAQELAEKHNITDKQINDYKESIVELEDTDF
jgi:hypothetical protein